MLSFRNRCNPGEAGFCRADDLLRIYYLLLFHEKRPEICPPFFQVDLARPIWIFVYRSEGERHSIVLIVGVSLMTVADSDRVSCAVYLFLLSLLPFWPAVGLLRSALDFRRRGAELGNRLPGSDTISRNALIAAIVGFIFAVLANLQQLAKVVRLRGKHLWHDVVRKARAQCGSVVGVCMKDGC